MSYPPNRPVRRPDQTYQPAPRYDPDGATQPVAPVPPQPQPEYPPAPYPPQPPVQSPPPYNPPWQQPRPSEQLEYYQPIRRGKKTKKSSRLPWKGGCCALLAILGVFICLALAFVAAAFTLSPGKTNILVLGIDRVDPAVKSNLGRSDTIVMVQVDPSQPRIATLAIPRDLWVKIPGVGENRINTAHFFAEANKAGSGPAALAQTIQDNFGIASTAYVRIHLEGVPAVIDAMGGVTITLTEATALYPVGTHHLDGTQALAFVRDRKGVDDFFRMAHGELFIKAAAQTLLNPLTWLRLPVILAALPQAVDTNIPTTQLPAMALALLRVGPGNIDSHTLPREYTTSYTTDAGAQVLLPRWDYIIPLVKKIFGN
jgi:polyisoprenyl-teichoic acid--peptidoglycan teichoic acid transferase